MMQTLEKGQFGYTRREENLNFLSHLFALFLSVGASIFILSLSLKTENIFIICAIVFFAISLILTFLSSALYHGLPDGRPKFLAKKFDHISIYLIICGIYSALLALEVWNLYGLALGIILWALTVWGCAKKFKQSSAGAEKNSALGLYIAIAGIIFFAFPYLNRCTIYCLLGAALVDSVGIYFYAKKGREFYHLAWHVFSSLACTFDFFAVYFALIRYI